MRRTELGHGVYRDSIYPAKSRGDPEKTQNCRQRPQGLGKAAGRNAEVSRWGLQKASCAEEEKWGKRRDERPLNLLRTRRD